MLYITYDSLNKRIRLDDDSVFICQYRAVIAPVNSFVTLLNPAIHLAHTKAQFSFFLVLSSTQIAFVLNFGWIFSFCYGIQSRDVYM